MGLRDNAQRAKQDVLRKDAEAAEAKAKAEQEKLDALVAPARAALPGLMAEWAKVMGLEHAPEVRVTGGSYEPGVPSSDGMVSAMRETQQVSFEFEEDGIEFVGQVEIIGADPGRERGGEAEPPALEITLRPASEDDWPGPGIASLEDLARALMKAEEEGSGQQQDEDSSGT
jgi:hypothetical protein